MQLGGLSMGLRRLLDREKTDRFVRRKRAIFLANGILAAGILEVGPTDSGRPFAPPHRSVDVDWSASCDGGARLNCARNAYRYPNRSRDREGSPWKTADAWF